MASITKLFARFFLWLIGIGIPVFIAACYGMPYQYSKRGKVIDSQTKDGISNLMVSCVRDGHEMFGVSSWDNGQFELSYDVPCDKVKVEDTDGIENGGLYESKTVPFCEGCGDIVIELNKVSQ